MRPNLSRSRTVLFLAPQPFYTPRGTPLNVKAFCERLAKLNYDVHLLVYPFGEDISLPGVTLHRCPRPPGISHVPIGFSWRKLVCDISLFFHALILSFQYDFSVFHGVEEAGVLAGILGFLRRRPYVVDVDSCIPEQLRMSGFARFPLILRCIEGIESFFMRHATAIVAVCPSLTRWVKEVAPLVPVFQIEDFPSECKISRTPEQRAELRAELGLDIHRQIILYTGNLESYQGIDLLLDSFELLLTQSPFFEAKDADLPLLLVVGGSGDVLERYRERVQNRGLVESIRLIGTRPASEMGKFLSIADVLSSPRLYGRNTPLKIYGYMEAEKAIVATDIESHSQIFDESTAYLAPPDPEYFAEALLRALDCSAEASAKRLKMINKATALVRSQYSKEAFDARVQELYAFLLPSPVGVKTTEVSIPSYASAEFKRD